MHPLTRVDRELWERFERLDEEELTATLGVLLNRPRIRGILKRRDRMAKAIEKLVQEQGESAVLLRYAGPRD